ncbi:hypothetical protein LL912_14535 [Niabella sp. CC-SYL272]|uniref:hypothetical protein n=1 Tax=Niabella agricola TaxID=2891571 RepID=UPI001F193C1A|nr:hypothetical protein [Niabella agricola]MCF3109996.1 hypothetical protein [Niabella agricola]
MNGFRFNTEKFDFRPIYEAIKRYYPIGVDSDPDFYRSYPGQIEFTGILNEHFYKGGNWLTASWNQLLKELSGNTNKEMINTSYGRHCCYSATRITDTITYNNRTHQNTIHFFVSLLAPFYTITGESQNILTVKEDDWLPRYYSTNYFVVPPQGEFSEMFIRVEEAIETVFKGSRFVPYCINVQELEGLYLENLDTGRKPIIFNVLFNDHIHLPDPKYRPVGDTFYKNEAWTKKGYDRSKGGGWTVYSPLHYCRNGADDNPEG